MTAREVLRPLAARWMELAMQPVMAERRRLWTAVKDLRAERPMITFETALLEEYVAEEELRCADPALRGVERYLRWQLRHAEEVGDDLILEPYFRVYWQCTASGYGVEIPRSSATDAVGGHHAYAFTHPIQTPDDLDRLQPRTWSVDRAGTERWAAQLDALFGDLLPVVNAGTGCLHSALTQEAFKLLGNDNLLLWPYDEPEALHRLMAYLRDDRIAYFTWLEREGLLGLNNNWTFNGSACGYTTALPRADYAGTPRLRDLWTWMESQETTMHAPEMFGAFFLPYMAAVANHFGLVYYGCCEPVHDRWDQVSRAMPRVRAVSVSPWCDMPRVATAFGQQYVFSRKPNPSPISGATPDWEALELDVDATLAAAEGCNLEFVFRDVYRIHGDRPRLRRWVEMVKHKVGA